MTATSRRLRANLPSLSYTSDEVQTAVELLKQAFTALSITVDTELEELSTEKFLRSTLESNRM